MPRPPLKHTIAAITDAIRMSDLTRRLLERASRPCIRSVNYHALGSADVPLFTEHLRWYADRYVPVGRTELAELQLGRWPHDRPGLLIAFDDGLRCVYDRAVPLLERFGFRGWFAIPTGFIDTPVADQVAYAAAHHITRDPEPPPDGRVAMTWDEIRHLDARGHVVLAHTISHRRLGPTTPRDECAREVAESKRRLEEQLGRAVDAFCWVGGEVRACSPAAAAAIRRAGYRMAFLNSTSLFQPGDDPLQIHRTNIEATNPMTVVRFQLSGLMDLYFTPRRRRIRRLITDKAN